MHATVSVQWRIRSARFTLHVRITPGARPTLDRAEHTYARLVRRTVHFAHHLTDGQVLRTSRAFDVGFDAHHLGEWVDGGGWSSSGSCCSQTRGRTGRAATTTASLIA